MLSRLHIVDTETRQVENDVIAAGSAWPSHQLSLIPLWEAKSPEATPKCTGGRRGVVLRMHLQSGEYKSSEK